MQPSLDEWYLAVDKPAGIAVVGDRTEPSLVDELKATNAYLSPVHRIDKVTSGLVLFALTPEAHAHAARMIAKRRVHRLYLAIVNGRTPEAGEIDLPLTVGRKGRVRVAGQRQDIVRDGPLWHLPAAPAGKGIYPSRTRFRRLAVTDDGTRSVLAAAPATGRRHQLRVHLAWIGHAICGDPLFGGGEGRTYLHSLGFRLPHPVGEEELASYAVKPDRAFVGQGADGWFDANGCEGLYELI